MPVSRRGSLLIVLLFFSLANGLAGDQGGGHATLAQGTRISLQLSDDLSTKHSTEGDTFTANVAVPLIVGDRILIPKGSVVTGSVSRIVRPGRFRGKAVMNVVFHSIRVPRGSQLPIVASLLAIEPAGDAEASPEGRIQGEASKGKDTLEVAKPAAAGAGIGALVAGGKAAAIGSGVGAAVGLATVFTTRGKDIEVPRGSVMNIVLDRPLLVPLEPAISIVKNQ